MDDVIAGAWKYDNGENDEGRAYPCLSAADTPAGWIPTETPLLLAKTDDEALHFTLPQRVSSSPAIFPSAP